MSWQSIQSIFCDGQLEGVAGSGDRPLKCFWNRLLLPVEPFPLIQTLHFVMGYIDFVCCCCDFTHYHQIKSSPTVTNPPQGTDLFGEHHNHPGRKFSFSVVLLESSTFFSPYIKALMRCLFFPLKNHYLSDFYKDDKRVTFSKFRCFAVLLGVFPCSVNDHSFGSYVTFLLPSKFLFQVPV